MSSASTRWKAAGRVVTLSNSPAAFGHNGTTKQLTEKHSMRPPSIGPGLRLPAALEAMADEAEEATVRLSRMVSRGRGSMKKVLPAVEAAVEAGKALSVTVPCDGRDVVMRCDLQEQHTVSWSSPIAYTDDAGHAAALDPGSINLYCYPRVTPQLEPGRTAMGDVEPSAGQLALLEKLVLRILLEDTIKYYECEDATGARPIHALLISNTEHAVRLALRLISARPQRMLDAHGKGPFHGENCMHVLCVQRREHALCEAFDTVAAALPRREIVRMLTMQADGAFFTASPVDLYGSTPLSYACVSGMKRAVIQILTWSLSSAEDEAAPDDDTLRLESIHDAPSSADISAAARRSPTPRLNPARYTRSTWRQLVSKDVDLNDYANYACRYSGFLPLHCVVACRMPKMVQFLLTLPGHPELHGQLANLHKKVAIGHSERFAALTPLQLATRLGDREMVRLLMASHSKVDWTWGSLTQRRVYLSEIDSINAGAYSVMELVAQNDAHPRTREMLGGGGRTNFMQGFIYTLFEIKFDKGARTFFYFFFVLDCTYLALLINLAFTYRSFCGEDMDKAYFIVYLAVMALELLVELSIITSWLNNNRQSRAKARIESGGVASFVDRIDRLLSGKRRHLRKAVSHFSQCSQLCTDIYSLPWRDVLRQLNDYHADLKLVSLVLSLVALMLLYQAEGSQGEGRVQADGTTIYSHLNSRAFGAGSSLPLCAPSPHGLDMISFVLALAFLFHGVATVSEALNVLGKLTGVEALGHYTRLITRIGRRMLTWLVVFAFNLIIFAITMRIMYPVEPTFRSWQGAVFALFLLASTGETFADFPPDVDYWYSWTQPWPSEGLIGSPNGIGFLILYILWIYLSLILLLNLLIAEMSNEYDHLKAKANVEYRLGFARRVLRAELFATRLPLVRGYAARKLRVGDLEAGSSPPQWYFTYVEVGRNAEGRKVQEGEDIFADMSDSGGEDAAAERRPAHGYGTASSTRHSHHS